MMWSYIWPYGVWWAHNMLFKSVFDGEFESESGGRWWLLCPDRVCFKVDAKLANIFCTYCIYDVVIYSWPSGVWWAHNMLFKSVFNGEFEYESGDRRWLLCCDQVFFKVDAKLANIFLDLLPQKFIQRWCITILEMNRVGYIKKK